MSKIGLWIVLGVLVLGGGYFLYTRQAASPAYPSAQGSAQQAQPSAAQEKSGTFSGTLSDLIARGGNYKCDWSHSVNNMTISGTTYVSGNKFAGSGGATTQGMTITTNEVGDGSMMYIWTDVNGVKSGTKMSYDSMKNAAPSVSQEKVDQARASMNYQCEPWIPDASKFVVPTDITFKAS